MRLVTYIQDNVHTPRLTLASIDRLVDSGSLAPGTPLRRCELVSVGADGPWATRMVSPADRVMWMLCGSDMVDAALPAGVRMIGELGDSSTPELILVSGADAQSRIRAVRSSWPGRPLLVCPLPTTDAEWAATVREASVSGRTVMVELAAALSRSAADRVDRATHLSWVLSSPGDLALESLPSRRWTEIRVESGLADDADWKDAFGVPAVADAPLTRTQLRLVAVAANGAPDRVSEGVRRLAGGHLDGVALRIRPRRGPDDLVLPPDQTAQLDELVARCRGRATVYRQWGFSDLPSTGVVAMFSGPSGTGKTLAAEIIAGRLGLDLYKIDLSAVVSKYIGETEKQLERLFGSAEAGDLVLFFDEADALFGKRSEVADAHDRYANIEVAYLLQRLESYPGLVIMATNLQRNIDDAFQRRISVTVAFEAPGEPQRKLIWQRSFPVGAPVDELDFDFLAKQFRITGGVIHNAALGAAFLAVDANGPITMERVVLAMKREFQKLGKLRVESEFGRYFHLVNGDDDAAPAR
ncbi:ATP-binding protein [Lentzea sp. NPDC005914]|uniref:ATP-binding protein n=1 Tax=Lentzea sp. NPDC005914 TaxID=3154572 RepID=UPI0033F9A64C